MTKLFAALAFFALLSLSACYFMGERGSIVGASDSAQSGSATNHAAAGQASLSVTDMYHMDSGTIQPKPWASPPSPALQ